MSNNATEIIIPTWDTYWNAGLVIANINGLSNVCFIYTVGNGSIAMKNIVSMSYLTDIETAAGIPTMTINNSNYILKFVKRADNSFIYTIKSGIIIHTI